MKWLVETEHPGRIITSTKKMTQQHCICLFPQDSKKLIPFNQSPYGTKIVWYKNRMVQKFIAPAIFTCQVCKKIKRFFDNFLKGRQENLFLRYSQLLYPVSCYRPAVYHSYTRMEFYFQFPGVACVHYNMNYNNQQHAAIYSSQRSVNDSGTLVLYSKHTFPHENSHLVPRKVF